MKRAAAIIIGFTPFHLLPMRELISGIGGDIHVFHPTVGEFGVVASNRPVKYLGGCNLPHRSRWAMYLSARRDIDKIMRDAGEVDLYVPHPFNPLANQAFFHTGSCRRFIYQDGILNYYDAVTALDSFSRRMRQRAKGLALGARYRIYGGHLSGIDARPVAGGFFTHPERIVGAEKFPSLRRLDFGHDHANARTGIGRDTLFLDQPIEAAVGVECARDLRRRTIEYTNSFGGRVFYKPHYAQGRVISCDRTWLPLDPELRSLPAEWAVERMNVANVVSFCTSALANVVMQNPMIGCHATAAGLIPVSIDGRATDLSEVLSGLGVRAVDLRQR